MRARISRRTIPVAALGLLLLLTGCGGTGTTPEADDRRATAPAGGPERSNPSPMAARPQEIPGLGPATRARIGAAARQVFVVTGETADSNRATAVLYERDEVRGWRPAAGPWPARNGRRGWTEDHRMGDLRSPIGVYGLTDAGGKLADPGTELPYDRRTEFRAPGRNVEGESLEEAFDYVVAINYNRVPGRTPLDWTRPLGEEKGGGIWVHVDHGAATQGCVALPKPLMRDLMKRLDPAARPVVVMGPQGVLAR
ncbi:L,D-transpeptidase family protein [Streptomyces sp. NPDC020965]|uniref:L,D-transpeptidase family protein n=1 Tax=Streptomyces sp. NPDC020965 TaxID=3365105 RepID=UPI0037953A29